MRRMASVVLFLAVGPVIAGQKEDRLFTQEKLDELWRESLTQDEFKLRWDSEAYQFVPRVETSFGTFKTWDIESSGTAKAVHARPECVLKQPYMTRTGGVQRGNYYLPEDFGRMFLENRVMYNDGLGNDVIESLLLSRKYGLRPYFYASDYYPRIPTGAPGAYGGTPIPFLKSEMPAYAEQLRRDFQREADFIRKLETFSGMKFLFQPDQFWLVFVGIDLWPVNYMLDAARKDFDAVNREFREEHGFDLPVEANLSHSEERARRLKMWQWALAKYGAMQKLRAELFREVVAGKGIIGSNVHMGATVDYERYGEAFDFPSAAIRPTMASSELEYRYYVGYACRLLNDLCDKLPQVSIRVNVPWAGSRVIPTPGAIRYWHSQAVQNGVRMFYIWLREYPSDTRPVPGFPWLQSSYGGQIFGQPDQSQLPMLRWNTVMEVARKLGRANVFVPPKSQTGILVSLDTNLMGSEGWKSCLSAYIELTQAGVWANFVSDQELWEGSERLDRYKVLYLPRIEFARMKVVRQIEDFLKAGGTLITADPAVFTYDDLGNPTPNLRKEIFGLESAPKRTVAGNRVTMLGAFGPATIQPYVEAFELTGAAGTEVIGTYPDGRTAAILKRHGAGRAILFGGNALDIAAIRNGYRASLEDTGRRGLYKKVERDSGVQDLSWIWDINIDNVVQVTGEAQTPPVKIDESVRFEWYQRPFMP